MTTLVLTIGLPGCGKSTRAGRWVAEVPANRARVGRDALRGMLRGELVWGDPALEGQTTVAQHAAVAALLAAGVSVVVDDTNLRPEHRAPLVAIAGAAGTEVEVWDMRDVPVEVCIARDAARPPGQRVGEPVIRAMAA